MKSTLSFIDKFVTPLSKEYKDFITEKENTPSEIFFKDGERKLTEKEKKFLEIYEFKNQNKRISVEEFYARQSYPKITLNQLDDYIQKANNHKSTFYLEEIKNILSNSFSLIGERPIVFSEKEKEKILEKINSSNQKIEHFNSIFNDLKSELFFELDKDLELKININDKFYFQNENLTYQVYSIREDANPKIYLEAYDEIGRRYEATFRQSNLEQLIKNQDVIVTLLESSIDYKEFWEKYKFNDTENSELSDDLTPDSPKFRNTIQVIEEFKENPSLLDELKNIAIKNNILEEIPYPYAPNPFEYTSQHYGDSQELADEAYEKAYQEYEKELEQFNQKWGDSDREDIVKELYPDEISILQNFITANEDISNKRIEFIENLIDNMQPKQENSIVQEIFNEIQEKFSPTEKAYLEILLIIPDNANLGTKKLIDFFDYSDITEEEKIKVNSYYYNKIEPIFLNGNDKIYWDLYKKTQIDDNFRKDVNPIFNNIIDKKHNDMEQHSEQTTNVNESNYNKLSDLYLKWKIEREQILKDAHRGDGVSVIEVKRCAQIQKDIINIYETDTGKSVDTSKDATEYLPNIIADYENILQKQKLPFMETMEQQVTQTETLKVENVKEFFNNYEIKPEIDLNHRDLYAFLNQTGKTGKEKLSELVKTYTGNELDFNQSIPKDKMLKEVIYPIKDILKEHDFKQELVASLSLMKQENQSNKYSVDEIKNFYNTYEIDPSKKLSHNDIYAFSAQMKKGGMKKVNEIMVSLTGTNPELKFSATKTEVITSVITPIKEANLEKDFKEHLVTALQQNLEKTQELEQNIEVEQKKSTGIKR